MARFSDNRPDMSGQGTLVARALSTVINGACLAAVDDVEFAVRVVSGLTVAVGNQLLIMRHGSVRWAVGIVTAAPTVPPTATILDPDLPGSPSPAPPPAPDPPKPGKKPPAPAPPKPPPPKPKVTTGTLVCPAVQTACYRNGKWRDDIGPINSTDLYQGRYAGSSYGRNIGVAFYGTKPRTLAGATITKVVLKVKRLTAGDYAARTPTLWLTTQASRPGGSPTLNESTAGPSLAVNQTNNGFVLPTSWGTALVNGSRGGIAVNVNADNPYMHFAGRGSWSAAFTLTLYWRRG